MRPSALAAGLALACRAAAVVYLRDYYEQSSVESSYDGNAINNYPNDNYYNDYNGYQTKNPYDPANPPYNELVTSNNGAIFRNLVGGIIHAQQQIQEYYPRVTSFFEPSVRDWIRVYEEGLDKRNQTLLIEAYTALSNAAANLGYDNIGFDPNIHQPLKELLIDNILLVGLLNEANNTQITPGYANNNPGALIGALIHFLAIDVTHPIRDYK